MTLSEMKREKEENIQKIKKIMENKDKYNFDDDNANIFDLDQFLLNEKKIEPIKKINIDKNRKPILNIKKEKENEKKENKIIRNIVDINTKNENIINKSNELKKDKIKKKQIKLFHINKDLENIKPKLIKDENQQKKSFVNNEDESESKNISKISNKVNKINIKNVNKEKKEIKETNINKEINKEISKETKKEKGKKKKKIYKSRIRKLFINNLINNELDETEDISENNIDENNLGNDKEEITYKKLMILFNNKFNIPGRKRNHVINKRKYSNDLYPLNVPYLSFINDTEKEKEKKEKLIKNKSFSYIKTRKDKKLILLRPLLRHILKKKNFNLKDLKDTINRLFNKSNANLIDINIINNQKYEISNKKNKEIISYDYYGNYEHYKNHRILMEKYFGTRKKLEKNYLQDDNDLLLNVSNEQKKKFVKRKAVRRRGFRDFMNDEDMLQPNQLSIDYFDNRKKENDRIRSLIEKERIRKKKKKQESEDKFNKFKSYIKDLKRMTEEQLRYDTIRFIFKIKADPENIKLSHKENRINSFKKYLKTNEIKKLGNNESILRNVLFQSNCIFYTDKITKL